MSIAPEGEHSDGIGSEVFSNGDGQSGEAGVEDGVVVPANGVERDEVGEWEV